MKLRWIAETGSETTEYLYFGRIYAGFVGYMKDVKDHERDGCGWRAWIATGSEEEHLGDFATRQQAKEAMEEAAREPA